MARYVVTVKPPDDHPGMIRVFGPWRDRAVAESFCESVRTAVDREDRELEELSLGFAWVQTLDGFGRNAAKRYAITGSMEKIAT